MKLFLTYVFLFKILISQSQINHTPEGVLSLPLQDYKRTKVDGASFLINGRVLKPQQICYIPEYCRGMYELDSFPQTSNWNLKVWVEVIHHDYEPFSDSVYIYQPFYLTRKGMHHYYFINKVPFSERGLVSVLMGVDMKTIKLGRTDYFIDSAVSCPSFKYDDYMAADTWYVKHSEERDLIAYLKKNSSASLALDFQNAIGRPSCIPITRTFSIFNLVDKDIRKGVLGLLDQWKKDGIIHSYSKNTSPTQETHDYHVVFTALGLVNFEVHLDSLVTQFGVKIAQDMALRQCPQ